MMMISPDKSGALLGLWNSLPRESPILTSKAAAQYTPTSPVRGTVKMIFNGRPPIGNRAAILVGHEHGFRHLRGQFAPTGTQLP
jgi:hypothetical protein